LSLVASDPAVACLASALETGTPSSGPSTWILKAPPGCIVPWHSHSAEGGFAMMPGRVAHQFTCRGANSCLMFITFDGAYDIKWGKS
jgi:hypothetical protein